MLSLVTLISITDLGKGESELGYIFGVLSEFQVAMIMEGFLVRGGISLGKHFMSDDIVFGDALLEAVAEDKAGGPPCITLSPAITPLFQQHLGFYTNTKDAPQYIDLLEDSDGSIDLNYLEQAFFAYPDGGIFFDVIEAHQKTIIQGLSKFKDVPGVVSKYEWAARYHNFICQEFVNEHPIPTNSDTDEIWAAAAVEAQKLLNYLIDIALYSSKPQRLTLKAIKPKFKSKA
jgi:hypothetical protein